MNTQTTTQEDLEMANYIFNVLSSRKIMMMSWGFHNPQVITDGLQFNVNGFVHNGSVQVIYQQGLDLFKIHLLNNEMVMVKEISEIYFDELVSVIDNNVEQVENYHSWVQQEYNFDKSHSNDKCIQINL